MRSNLLPWIGCTLLLFCFEKAYPQPSFAEPDSVIQQLYEVLSGAPGDHDWQLFLSLFHEKSVMGAVVTDEQGNVAYRSITPQEYVDRNSEFFRTRAFYVAETNRITEQFGEIAHLFSTYQYRLDADGREQPAALQQSGRGINSIQLVREENRWWIVSIQYTNERPDLPVPQRYTN